MPIIDPTQVPTLMDEMAGDPVFQAVQESQLAQVDDEAEKAAIKAENDTLKKVQEEYDQARAFDKNARKQYAVDRRYASGTADVTWAVDTNLIGGMIDVLVSFLYARTPDVSVRKAPNVDNRGTKETEDLAKTLELTISSLWKRSTLKQNARKAVRSGLSTSVGWLKATMVADNPQGPQMQTEMNDLRDNIKRAEALRNDLYGQYGAEGSDAAAVQRSVEEQNAEIARLNELEQSLQTKMEAAIRKYFAVDFLPAETVQVSTDVGSLSDYRDAGWVSNYIHVKKRDLKSRFPRLTDDDVRAAKIYYQKAVNKGALAPVSGTADTPNRELTPDDADQYTSSSSSGGSEGDSPEFVRVIEQWDRHTGHVRTWVDGCKRWAVEPYQPPYPSTRFYPYFQVIFYEVDGSRHPQSLSMRLHKLQDEYARSRSNFRLTRERSIPGVLVNGSQVAPTEASKLAGSVHQEIITLTLTDPTQPISAAFAQKPVGDYDPRIFDTQPILADMEKIAGVQEALQSSTTTPKTATEANIQQTGFASRTTADRDTLEEMLSDMALYTAEQALTALSVRDVQRICGSGALWPSGMAIDDLLTMTEVSIVAGTTGKPKADQDKQVWGMILPQLIQLIPQLQQAQLMGNQPLEAALTEIFRETMVRMGDDTDITRFIPQAPTTPMLSDPAAGAALTGGSPAPVPSDLASGGAPEPGLTAPTITNPQL